MQTIPHPVYYVLVMNDGEILAGHYCFRITAVRLKVEQNQLVAGIE